MVWGPQNPFPSLFLECFFFLNDISQEVTSFLVGEQQYKQNPFSRRHSTLLMQNQSISILMEIHKDDTEACFNY